MAETPGKRKREENPEFLAACLFLPLFPKRWRNQWPDALGGLTPGSKPLALVDLLFLAAKFIRGRNRDVRGPIRLRQRIYSRTRCLLSAGHCQQRGLP